ncbi:MAG: hypothetical protein L3J23_00400 [Flavobacteriaceae bacterium]|nr:hypothetical protein [Flavobacteriaceae bacterium]
MPERIIPSTLHLFITPFTFIIIGGFVFILSSIEYKFKYPELFLMLIVLILNFGSQNIIEKAIIKWDIEKDYKTLTKGQRRSKNIFAFIFFWGSFALFLYLTFTYFSGYSMK